jgi:hypothetical protein
MTLFHAGCLHAKYVRIEVWIHLLGGRVIRVVQKRVKVKVIKDLEIKGNWRSAWCPATRGGRFRRLYA